MKLATYKDGSRDGQLVVVSRDLSQAHFASHLVNHMQSVLDDWNYLAPQLQDISDALNAGRARYPFPFDPAQCMAPLPRAYQWVSGGAYGCHQALLDQAYGAPLTQPVTVAGPVLRQGAGDALLGARDTVRVGAGLDALDFEAQLAVVCADLACGVTPERALEGVRLVMLANALHACSGVGAQAMLAAAFSPVAVTPDELGASWSRGRVDLALQCHWNGRQVGQCEAGADMTFHFGQLLSALASTRALGAGTVMGSGAVSNRGGERQGQPHWPRGYSSIAEKRAMETLLDGQPATPYLQHDDTLQIDMKNGAGQSVFGAIELTLQWGAGVTRASAAA